MEFSEVAGAKKGAQPLPALRLVFLIIMAVVLLTMGGCNLTEKLQALQGKPPAQSENLPDLVTGGMSNLPPQVEKTKVTVYFKDKEGRFLVPSILEVDKVAGIAKVAADALCRGPAQGVDVVASIPVDVQVRNINIKTDGTCVVDLAGPAAKDKLTAKEEALAVYAVVDTLTEFRNVQRVQIPSMAKRSRLWQGTYQSTSRCSAT